MIQGITIVDALVDLGASINVMPLSIYKMWNLGQLKAASVGEVEDVLVKVKQLFVLVDFYILDMQVHKASLILGNVTSLLRWHVKTQFFFSNFQNKPLIPCYKIRTSQILYLTSHMTTFFI